MTRGVGGQSASNVAQHLKGIDFPVKRDDLVKHAQKNDAGEDILGVLKSLPDQEYNNMADVMKAYGEERSGGEGRGEKSGGSRGEKGGEERGGGRGGSGGGSGGGRSHKK